MSFSRLNALLLAVAALLGGLLYAEVALLPSDWLAPSSAPAGTTRDPAPPPVLNSAAWELPSDDLPSIASLDETVSRPLFIAGRRPPSETPQVEVSAPVASAAPLPLPQLTLTGIVFGGERPLAYALDPATGQPKAYGEGETIDGWRVETIRSDNVVLERSGRSEQINLRPELPKGEPPPARPRPRPRPRDTARAGDREARVDEATRRRQALNGREKPDRESISDAEREAEELREIEELEAAIEEQERELRELDEERTGEGRLRQRLNAPSARQRRE